MTVQFKMRGERATSRKKVDFEAVDSGIEGEILRSLQ